MGSTSESPDIFLFWRDRFIDSERMKGSPVTRIYVRNVMVNTVKNPRTYAHFTTHDTQDSGDNLA